MSERKCIWIICWICFNFIQKSTQMRWRVVLMKGLLRYNDAIKERRLYAMNTDKIYAEQLANEYAPKDTSKVVALRKLDARAKLPATIFTYTFGIVSALVTGVGMCLSMNVIGNGTTVMFILGIIIGIIGLTGMGVNYPIYRKLLENGKQKYAFEIMELAKEISDK